MFGITLTTKHWILILVAVAIGARFKDQIRQLPVAGPLITG